MNTKALCITVLVVTILIFGGNHYAARNEFPAEDCETCNCRVTVTVKNPSQKSKPSCSVVFNGTRRRQSSSVLYAGETGELVSWPFSACDFVLFCDKEGKAKLTCENQRSIKVPFVERRIIKETTTTTTDVWGNQKCPVFCERSGDQKL